MSNGGVSSRHEECQARSPMYSSLDNWIGLDRILVHMSVKFNLERNGHDE